jgi:hypothetical protein
MKVPRFLGVLFTLIGTGLLVGGLVLFLSTRRFVASAATATGVVVDLVQRDSEDTDDGPTYRPVVEFTTAAGHKVRFTSSFGSNPPSHRSGDAVTVLYDPAAPQGARIRSFLHLWFGVLILGFVGVVFSGVGCGLLIAGRRR